VGRDPKQRGGLNRGSPEAVHAQVPGSTVRIACLQHVPFEGPAAVRPWAVSRGFPLSVIRLFANEPLPALDGFDLLVVLGGPMSVRDEKQFDWLGAEKEFVRNAIEKERRVLGICLGAQLIAHALGARVIPNREREIGWFPVEKSLQAQAHPAFAPLPETFTAFHWHGETFDQPAGSIGLARSEACAHQAFAAGERVLGLQFHLESTAESVEALIQHCPGDLSPGRFVQAPQAMATAHDHVQESNRLLALLLDRFVSDR